MKILLESDHVRSVVNVHALVEVYGSKFSHFEVTAKLWKSKFFTVGMKVFDNDAKLWCRRSYAIIRTLSWIITGQLNESLRNNWMNHYGTIEWIITELMNESLRNNWMNHYGTIEWIITELLNESLQNYWMNHYETIEWIITELLNES